MENWNSFGHSLTILLSYTRAKLFNSMTLYTILRLVNKIWIDLMTISVCLFFHISSKLRNFRLKKRQRTLRSFENKSSNFCSQLNFVLGFCVAFENILCCAYVLFHRRWHTICTETADADVAETVEMHLKNFNQFNMTLKLHSTNKICL